MGGERRIQNVRSVTRAPRRSQQHRSAPTCPRRPGPTGSSTASSVALIGHEARANSGAYRQEREPAGWSSIEAQTVDGAIGVMPGVARS